MTEEEILAEWERVYGKLPLERRDRFLTAGGYVERLSKLEDDVVYDAIASEYGPVMVRRPGRAETVIDQVPCSTCAMRLTPENRCACS